MKPWKCAEKQVAKILGGRRRIRVQYSESIEDVIHPMYAIEVKYGKQIPKWVVSRCMTVNERYILFPLEYLPRYGLAGLISLASQWPVRVFKSKTKFIEDGLRQALSYREHGIALLCMKRPRMRGVVGCLDLDLEGQREVLNGTT